MNRYTKIKNIEKVLNWCITYYGMSKYYTSYPILVITFSKCDYLDGEFRVEGSLNQNEVQIVMYLNNLRTIAQITKTVIHEYQHYLQNPGWLSRYYKTLAYDKNKYELNAEKEANSKYKKCIEEIKL